MEKEYTDGVMGEGMLAPTTRIKRKALGFIIGLMEDVMKVNGRMVREMALAKLYIQMAYKSMLFGLMTNVNR
jgi:hypothetical protein